MSVVALLMVKTLAGRSLCVLTCVAKKTSSKPLIAMRQTSANIPEDRVPMQGRNRRDRGVRSNGFMAGMNRWHKKVDWRIIQRFRRRWPIWYYKGTSINGQQSTMQITTKATESFQNVVIVFWHAFRRCCQVIFGEVHIHGQFVLVVWKSWGHTGLRKQLRSRGCLLLLFPAWSICSLHRRDKTDRTKDGRYRFLTAHQHAPENKRIVARKHLEEHPNPVHYCWEVVTFVSLVLVVRSELLRAPPRSFLHMP